MIDATLTEPVDRFIDELTPHVVDIGRTVAGIDAQKLAGDVTVEVNNLVAAFIDADGRHTDDELWAYLTTFAPRSDTLLQYATPAHVRDARLCAGKARWLDVPSLLFDVLIRADRQRGTTYSWTYYERAMEIAHTVCSLDAHPSHTELTALERYRSLLLRTMELAGVGRPGAPRPAAATATPGAAPAAPTEEELGPPRPLEELMAELDALVGLAPVKAEIKLVADLIQVQNLRRQRNLPVAETSRHLVFTGNPGTGKTTVARLLAQIYRTLEVVDKGHLVETDRSGLVAGYVGQTAIQVRKVFESALGGILLVDEAYALARGDQRDFGQEAIDTLVKLVEDHRDEIVVVAAGYPDEMQKFVDSNPGLRSRFPRTIHFPDYTTDELVAIFCGMAEANSYTLTAKAKRVLRDHLDAIPRDKGFGNGRLARNLFEEAIARQASRIVAMKDPSNEEIVKLVPADIAGVAAPPPAAKDEG